MISLWRSLGSASKTVSRLPFVSWLYIGSSSHFRISSLILRRTFSFLNSSTTNVRRKRSLVVLLFLTEKNHYGTHSIVGDSGLTFLSMSSPSSHIAVFSWLPVPISLVYVLLWWSNRPCSSCLSATLGSGLLVTFVLFFQDSLQLQKTMDMVLPITLLF